MANDNRDGYTGEEYDEDVAPDLKEAERKLEAEERVTDGAGAVGGRNQEVDDPEKRSTLIKLGSGLGLAGLLGVGGYAATRDKTTQTTQSGDNNNPGAVNQTERSEEIEDKTEETTEEEPVEEEDPVYQENMSALARELDEYVAKVDPAEAAWNAEQLAFAWEDANGEPWERVEQLLEYAVDADNARTSQEEMERKTNELAKSFYTHLPQIREMTDTEVPNYIFNVSTLVGNEPVAEAYKVKGEENVDQPTVHGPNGSITFGQNNNTPWLTRVTDSTDWAVMYPQDETAISDRLNHFDPPQEELRRAREKLQKSWSGAVPGLDLDDDVLPYSSDFRGEEYEAQYKNPDETLAEETWKTIQNSDRLGNGEITFVKYENGEVELEDDPDFEYGDPLPGDQ